MSFQTPQYSLNDLLDMAQTGALQLPDFQRPYRWNDERIRSLLVTILRGHPMGVLMTLRTGGSEVRFKPRPVEGSQSVGVDPELLLLDGQQRTTSLFQALTGDGVVETEDDRHKKMSRKYFVDIRRAMGTPRDQDVAVVSLPGNGIALTDFGRRVELDVSTEDGQIEHGLMPISTLFDQNAVMPWLFAYFNSVDVPEERAERIQVFQDFTTKVLTPLSNYAVPAIELGNDTTREAVATVFEKVNVGGMPLDVFELLTATFAGDNQYYEEYGEDFRLAEDWKKTQDILAAHPVLKDFRTTDFLMGVSVLVTLEKRQAALGRKEPKPPATSARREDILAMRLGDYLPWAERLRTALPAVARHLHSLHIHTASDIPYKSQVVSLGIIHVLLGVQAEEYAIRDRLNQWFWCGVLGEQYGSTIEGKLARDAEQVADWARGVAMGEQISQPDIVARAQFAETRLGSLRTRNSAAYKGIYALLMAQEVPCRDWKMDQIIDHSSYQDLKIDIHHIFPKQWCIENNIPAQWRESIINKTPLSRRTNIQIGGVSPAIYMQKLDAGLPAGRLDALVGTHAIDPATLREGDFNTFFLSRLEALVALIEKATGKSVNLDWDDNAEEEVAQFEETDDIAEDGLEPVNA